MLLQKIQLPKQLFTAGWHISEFEKKLQGTT